MRRFLGNGTFRPITSLPQKIFNVFYIMGRLFFFAKMADFGGKSKVGYTTFWPKWQILAENPKYLQIFGQNVRVLTKMADCGHRIIT